MECGHCFVHHLCFSINSPCVTTMVQFLSPLFSTHLSFRNVHKNKGHTTVNEPQKSPANEFTQTRVLISATRSTYRPEIISSEGMWSWCSIRFPPVNTIPHIHYFSLMRIRNTELGTERWFI